MISEEKINNIKKDKIKKKLISLIDYVIFIFLLFVSYNLNFQFNNDTTLFNDKLIDVCSIFFGVFIGSIFLFEKFKTSNSYSEFLKFSKNLLYLNLLIIVYSFVIILVNPILLDNSNVLIKFKPKVLIFSIYISIFGVVVYKIYRFIKIILVILKSEN